MYLVCTSFGELPRELSEFPAFSAENKTFNKINSLCQRIGRAERKEGSAQESCSYTQCTNELQSQAFGDRNLIFTCFTGIYSLAVLCQTQITFGHNVQLWERRY